MAKYAIMPAEDYLDACNATREKTGGTDPIKSGELGGQIRAIASSGTGVDDALITRTITSYANDRVTSIGAYAFCDCMNLTTINFPLVTSIGRDAFVRCYKLTAADFPLITLIDTMVFLACKKLVTINFPLVEKIEARAFDQCVSLVVADFPKVTYIGPNAFDLCTGLSALCLRNTETVCEQPYGAFYDSAIAKGTGYIYVPRALVERYKVAANWSTYAAQFRALEDYTVDGTVAGELDMSKI